MKIDFILSNPADKVDLPKIEKFKPKFYTSDEVKTLLLKHYLMKLLEQN